MRQTTFVSSTTPPAVRLGGCVLLCSSLLALVYGRVGTAEKTAKVRDGRVVGCEHFAFLRPSMSEGLGGPVLEALKSWDGEMGGTLSPDGSYYQTDVNNSIVFRVRGRQARVFAGTGVRGRRDGPADQARFDFGVGSYSDADVHCDARGDV